MKKGLLNKIELFILSFSTALSVGLLRTDTDASKVNALEGFTAVTPSADFTGKTDGCNVYNKSLTYGHWKIVNGANNYKGWAYFKMGGKSATLSTYNPCYIYSSLAASDQIDRIDVHIPAGSLSKTGMSVNSWGVYIYSDEDMKTQIDYVAGDTITSSEKTFTFIPSTGKTWAKNSYVKVSWDLANTTTTNGIILVDKISLYKIKAAANYTVNYDAGYGTGPSPAQKAAYTEGDTALTLPSTGYSKTGYTFDGWSKTNGGDKNYDLGASYTPTGDTTLYAHYTIESYEVTPNLSNCSKGSETLSVNYDGTYSTTITANEGYTLPSDVQVTGGTKSWNQNTGALSISNVTGPVSYTVTAIIKTYTVSDANVCNGTLSNTSDINHGTAYSATLSPNSGYSLPNSIEVKIGGSNSNNFSYNNETGEILIGSAYVTGNIEISAVCYIQYTITVNITNGYADSSSDTTIKTQDSALIQLVANSGYALPAIGDMTINGATLVDYTDGLLEIENPTDNVVITLDCVSISNQSITVNMDNVVASGDTEIKTGGTASVTITANTGYRLPSEADFVISGATSTFVFSGTSNVVISLSECTGDVTIEATAIQTFNVYVGEIVNGEAIITSSSVVDAGGTATFLLTADTGYKLPSTISVTGGTLNYDSTTGVISVSDVNGNVTLNANMTALENYTVTVTATNLTQTTSVSTIQENGSATLIFSANSGYGLPEESGITVSGATLTSWTKSTGTLIISNPVSDVSLSITADNDGFDSISLSASSGTYTLGDSFVMPVVTAHYKYSGDIVVTNDAVVSGFDPYTVGVQNVTVSYTDVVEKTAEYTATVQAKQITTTDKWSKVTTITSGKYLIATKNSSGEWFYLPTATTTTAPSKQSLTLVNDLPSFDSSIDKSSYLWNVTVTNNLLTIKNDSNSFLYCINDSNGVRVDSKEDTWTYSSNTLKETNNNKYLGTYTSDWRSYATSDANNYNGTGKNITFFSVLSVPSATKSLVKITAEYSHSGNTYYTGDRVTTDDFILTALYDTNETTHPTDFTITNPVLSAGDNLIEIAYTEEGVTKSCTVAVNNIETRVATVDHVYIELATDPNDNTIYLYKQNYYKDGDNQLSWDFSGINVVVTWSDNSISTIPLADLIQAENASVSPSNPDIGTTSFTVTGSYYGSPIDNEHNTVSGITVQQKKVSTFNWNVSSSFSYNVFEGSSFDFDNLGTLVATWNDGTREPDSGTKQISTMINNNEIQLCLWKKYSESGKPDCIVDDSFTWSTEYEGCNMGFTYGGTRTHKTAKFHIINTLNAVNCPNGTIKKTYSTSSFNDDFLPSSAGTIVNKQTIDGITFETLGGYNFNSHIALPKTKDDYFKNSTPFNGNILSIQIKKGSKSVGSTSTLYVSADNLSWSSLGLINTNGQTFNLSKDNNYRYFKIVTDGSNYTNIGQLVVNYEGSENIANTNINVQDKVIEFAKYLTNQMDDVCISFDTKSSAFIEAWNNVASKYDELFGAETKLNSEELATALKMLQYAHSGARNGETADILQSAVARYDRIISRDNTLNAFITRAIVLSAPNTYIGLRQINANDSIWIVGIISLIGLTSVGGYFFYKKRKETF